MVYGKEDLIFLVVKMSVNIEKFITPILDLPTILNNLVTFFSTNSFAFGVLIASFFIGLIFLGLITGFLKRILNAFFGH